MRRILKFLRDRPTIIEGPRSMGSALKGSKLGEFWKYRVGDYRVICRSEDQRFLILVLRIGYRRELYR
ncbi:MAG TPA: type II toxin-antitoxin system RelE/ParE family toxin [Candidatus Binatia bacterium]|nr:type II toxin-antitoxin system RelE/ParE family toxin [Candidatus Binatia bacterium]